MGKDEIIDYIQKTFSEHPDYLKNRVVDEDNIAYCHDAIKYRIHPDHQAEFGTFCVVAMAACENDRPQACFNNLF